MASGSPDHDALDAIARAEAADEDRVKPGTKRDRRWLRDNWYRDVWLFIVTVIVLGAALKTADLAGDFAQGRKDNVIELCRNNQAQDDVLRTILNTSLEQQRVNPRTDAPLSYEESVALAEQLMAPLGGLRLTDVERRDRCQRQVDRFVDRLPPP